jgi:WD40 repeat protein
VRSFEHKGEVMCVALNQSGSLLVTGQGKLIYLWDVETGAQTSFKKGHADIVRCLAVKEERVLSLPC